jgi:LuxR family quorum sensing-dependent transcriptional regulator
VDILYPRVLSLIDRLPELKSTEESWSVFREFARYYGFSCGAIADLPDPTTKDFADNVFCVDWPEAWQQRYLEQNYVGSDPAVLHLTRSLLPYSWEDLLDCPEYTKQERNIVLEANEFSLNSGFVVPLPGLRSGSAILTIAGDGVDLSPNDRAELQLAAIYTHSHLRGLVRPKDDRPQRGISPRERECLHWAAAGKTDWEISEILSISPRTANFHLENAKRKFNVATKMQAVVLALREGIISP